MERTVPKVASEEIELYLRTYYSLLRSSTEVKIRTLIEAHAGMNSLLHPAAREQAPDMSAFIYCLLRLPSVMPHVRFVVLGQSQDVFIKNGIGDIGAWQQVTAPARRRRSFYNDSDTLACLIASRSDIDDLIPMLTAYQIEWNKMHLLMRGVPEDVSLFEVTNNISMQQKFADILQISQEDLVRLMTIWGDEFSSQMQLLAANGQNLRVRLLNSSLSEYRRATHAWWDRIAVAVPEISERPVYFVSSNSHSLVNIITGFALQHEEELVQFLEESQDDNLLKEWADIQLQEVPSSRENFFYYLLKKYFQTPAGKSLKKSRKDLELSNDITRITSEHSFDLEAQVIKLSNVDIKLMDPRLHQEGDEILKQSEAIILNIDYPLGMAANGILQEVSEHVGEILGVYIVGKAATLNGVVGDVMIPKVVYDGHSRNTYIFSNCFDAADVNAYLSYGSVLDNQKAVTVQGTFLQNSTYMDVFYDEGYTDIEMEAGPYLSAVYEMFRPKRHPRDEIVNLYELPFDLGILHYASDKPLSKGKNLGVANLSYFGMDPTYATSLPVLKRIFEVERKRLTALNQK